MSGSDKGEDFLDFTGKSISIPGRLLEWFQNRLRDLMETA